MYFQIFFWQRIFTVKTVMTWAGLIFACQVIFLGKLPVHFNWHFSSSFIVTFLKMEIHSTWKLSLTFCITTLPSSKTADLSFFSLYLFNFFKLYLLLTSHHHIWCHCSLILCIFVFWLDLVEWLKTEKF